MNEQRLPYLQAAIDCGTIRAAADQLGIAPSAVSRQIALLEQELSISLLERHRKGVVPTEAGRLLADYQRQQAAHQADMLTKVEALRGLRRGHVTVVTGEGFIDDLIQSALRHFRESHPQISVAIDITGTSEILRRVGEDEAELGLVYNPPADPRIVSRSICEQALHVIVSPDSPLRNRQRVALRELVDLPVALLHGTYGVRQLLAHAEYADKVRLNPALVTNLMAVLKLFVASGQGITLLPRVAVARELAAEELFAVSLDNPVLTRAEMHLITRVGRRLSPAANQFLAHCQARMPAFQVAGQPAAEP